MAKWVKQSDYPSGTNRARTRTRYLSALQPDIERAAQQYFAANPDGEQVTVAALAAIGAKRLQAMAPGKPLDDLKKDAGLFIAITLADTYRGDRVATYRSDDGRAASTRPVRQGGPAWVANYTPHRLLPERPPQDRILLDTSVVRKIVHDDPDGLDLDALGRLKGDRPVSIPDIALMELAYALLRPGGLPIDRWARRVNHLDRVLDPEWPLVPGGWELAVLSGLVAMPGVNIAQARAYYRAVWRYLADAKSASDLSRKARFEAGDGTAQQIGPLDLAKVEAARNKRIERWRAEMKAAAARGETDAERIAEATRATTARSREEIGLLLDPELVDKLDLVTRVHARRCAQAAATNSPYTAADDNDALDFELLYGVQMPAVVCTADRNLVKLARASGSRDAERVMTPSELLESLQR